MFTLISDVIADNLFLFRVLGSILIFVLFWAFKGTITKTVVKLLTKLLNRSRQIADQSTLRFVLGPLKHFLAISGLYLALMNLHPGAGWSDFCWSVPSTTWSVPPWTATWVLRASWSPGWASSIR